MEHLEALKNFHKAFCKTSNVEGNIKLKFSDLKEYIKFKNFLSDIMLISSERIDKTSENSLVLKIELSELQRIQYSKLEVNIDLIQSEMRF